MKSTAESARAIRAGLNLLTLMMRRFYGLMVRVSTETAWPLGVVTTILPVVPPAAAIAEKGITKVVPSVEVTETSLFLQNFTVIGEVVKPAPVMVSEPPAESEIVVADKLEMVGA